MEQLINTLFLLLLSGCWTDPYTHAPIWTGTDWYGAGIQDATSGYVVKDNETLANNYNDPNVDRTEYLKGYAERRRKTCQQDLVYARDLTGKAFPSSCDTIENVGQLYSAWQQGANEGAASIRLD